MVRALAPLVFALPVAFGVAGVPESAPAASCTSVRSDVKQADVALNRAFRNQNDGNRNAAASLAAAAVALLTRANQAVFYGSAPEHGCLDRSGRMRLVMLNSKANVLTATWQRTSGEVEDRLDLQRRLLAAVARDHDTDPASMNVLKRDMRTIQSRYDALAGAESAARAGGTASPRAPTPEPVPASPSPVPPPSATQPPCAQPNAPALALRAAPAEIPVMAQQQGITGTVAVLVSLGADSRVLGTRIVSSPSAILNNAALTAARRSTFQTEIRDCVPIPSEFLFRVSFTNR